MTGRKQTDMGYQAQSITLLNKMPEYMRDFYYFTSEQTEVNRYHNLGYINRFLKWLAAEGFDIESPQGFSKINGITIKKYLEIGLEKLSAGSKGAHYAALKVLFKYLRYIKMVDDDPMEVVPRPKERKETEVVAMTHEEVERFMQAIEDKPMGQMERARNRCICALMLVFGLRRGSVQEIDVEDVDLDKKILKVMTKGRFYRELPLDETLIKFIMEWMDWRNRLTGLEDEDAFFISVKTGKRVSLNAINRMVRDYAKLAGIDKPITAHKLRSTCATNLYDETRDIYLVSKLLGHANVQTTTRYAGVTMKQLEEAVGHTSNLIK